MVKGNRFFSFIRMLLIILSIIVILLGSVFIYLLTQKDQIIRLFVKQANEHLLVKVEVEKIDLNLFSNFPDVSIRLKGLQMQGSDGLTKPALLEASTLSFHLNLIDLLQKRYLIQSIDLSDAEINLITDGKGKINYRFVERDSSQMSETFSFALKGLYLNNTLIHYRSPDTEISVAFDRTKAAIQSQQDLTKGSLKGLVTVYQLKAGAMMLLQNTDLELDADVRLTDQPLSLKVSKANLRYRNSDFSIQGELDLEENPQYQIEIKSDQIALEDLKSLLPGQVSEVLRAYKAGGQASLTMNLNKKAGQKNGQARAEFQIRNGSMSHPSTPGGFSDINLTGSLKNIGKGQLQDYQINIDTLTFRHGSNQIGGKLSLRDFDKPQLKSKWAGTMPATELQAFVKPEVLQIQSGSLDFYLSYDQSFGSEARRTISGEVACADVGLLIPQLSDPIQVSSAQLLFNDQDLVISPFQLSHRGQQLSGSAMLYNIFTMDSTQTLLLGAQLKSNAIVLDSLSSADDHSSAQIGLPKGIVAQIKLETEKLSYKRHRYQKVQAGIYLDSQDVSIQGLNLQMAGGSLTADINLHDNKDESFTLSLSGNCKKVPVDTLFYFFQDFDQQFITHQHLRGELSASGLLHARLKSDGNLIRESLKADIELTAENGRLYQFDPMKELSRFADEQELSDIRFKTITNKFHIENQTLYIPEMIIGSSLRDLTVSGTHGFDQKINYRIKLPISKPKATDKDERFGAIEQDASGKLYLYLLITGTTDDMKIQYDRKAVTGKISERFKTEKEELKQLFKFKSDSIKVKPKKIELEENNYFDFD